jgi:hypothetical protein
VDNGEELLMLDVGWLGTIVDGLFGIEAEGMEGEPVGIPGGKLGSVGKGTLGTGDDGDGEDG